jgi:Fe-S oxidoreductase
MCPSYQVTGDERHATRGRANSLRLALTGQLGPDALVSDAMKETMALCVGCKACRRECPTGVDMSRMKIEFLHQWNARHGLSPQARLTAYLPRYAPVARHLAPMINLRNRVPALGALGERLLGISRRRALPAWRGDIYEPAPPRPGGREVALFTDCFSRYFEPENAYATRRVLEAAGYSVIDARADAAAADGSRPLCCGRTFLSAGVVDEARVELTRLVDALGGFAERGVPIVGIEPSCLLTLRDELAVVVDAPAVAAIARQAVLLEELIAGEARRGALALPLRDLGPRDAFVHGHCHQKALGAMPDVLAALRLVPGLAVHPIESSCCGMAGSFGYEAEHHDISIAMAERSLLPAVRRAPAEAWIVADGTSCRHQIADGAGRAAVHVARVLEAALEAPSATSPTG